MSADLAMDRHTVAKHVTRLEAEGTVEHKTKGKSKLYKVTESALFTVLQNGGRLKRELQSVLGNNTLQTLDFDVVITPTGDGEGRKCYEYWTGRETPCPNCPADKAIQTGNPSSSQIVTDGKEATVTTTPIKNDEDRIVGIMENIQW